MNGETKLSKTDLNANTDVKGDKPLPQSGLPQQGEVVSPHVVDGIIEEIANEVFGLSVTACRQLNGYRDKNFHLLVSPDTCNPHLKSVPRQGYVMKVINTIDTNQPDILYVQTELMKHLQNRDIPVQEAVPAKDGRLINFYRFPAPDDKGETRVHAVCLRTFITGEVLYDITLTPDLCYKLGEFLGDITNALKDFYHPFYDTFDVIWSMNNVPQLSSLVHVITDPEDRRIINDVIREYSNTLLPRRHELRAGFIHGDPSEQNIIVRREGGDCNSTSGILKIDNPSFEVVGILDYEHAAYTHPLYDLAIMVAYVSLKAVTFDPLEVGGHIVAGYRSRVNLPEVERSLLRVAVAARLAQSLVIGAYSHTLDPSNEYILATSAPGWKVVRALWSTPSEVLYRRWGEIENSYETREGAVQSETVVE